MFLRLSPIGCRTMEINKNNSKNTYKSLQNWWQFHLKSMLAQVMQKTLKMTPTWCQNGGRDPSTIHETAMPKKTHEKWCKNEASKSYGPEPALGPGVPEEVRSSSRDSRSRFPLASNILQKANTQQTTKKQSPRTSSCHLTRTWRAGRHGTSAGGALGPIY